MYQVRDGQRVSPTCNKCGCRLYETERALTHFYGDETHDARGCLCKNYNEVILVAVDAVTQTANLTAVYK